MIGLRIWQLAIDALLSLVRDEMFLKIVVWHELGLGRMTGVAIESLTVLGALLRQLLPHIPEVAPKSSSTAAAWFLQPEQQLIESLLTTVIMIVIARHGFNGAWNVQRPACTAVTRSTCFRLADWVVKLLVVGTMIATLIYKSMKGHIIYLLQPCHIQNAILVYLAFNRGQTASKLFHLYSTTLYGAWLALLTPDLRGLDLYGEVTYFFTQHIALVLVPMYFVAVSRFVLSMLALSNHSY